MTLNEYIEKLELLRDEENAGEKQIVLEADSETKEPRIATACGTVIIY